jgi:hypothetical protein
MIRPFRPARGIERVRLVDADRRHFWQRATSMTSNIFNNCDWTDRCVLCVPENFIRVD